MDIGNIFLEPIGRKDILEIAKVLALANVFISIYAGKFLERNVFAAIRIGLTSLLTSYSLIWSAIVICLLGALFPDSLLYGTFLTTPGKFIGIMARLGVFIWIIGVIVLLYSINNRLSLNKRDFPKPTQYQAPADDNYKLFEIPEIEGILKNAAEEGGRIRFPMILLGDEETRIWDFSQNFLISSLKSDKVAVYFAFSRPADEIIGNFHRFDSSNIYKNLHIVDCYSGMYSSKKERSEKAKKIKQYGANVYFCDPRNPYRINKEYCKIIRKNLTKKLAVVYETISDFFYLTDREISVNFFRNNAVWEEQNKVNSMYLLKRGIIDSFNENQIIWFLNTKIELSFEEKPENSDRPKFKIITRMLFDGPRNFLFNGTPSFFRIKKL
jgi:hypothetical protein